MKIKASAVLCACALLAAASPALAQTGTERSGAGRATAPTQARGAQTPRDDASADLSINARVTADSLRFEKVPNPRVEFPGRPERATVWEAERENLPQEVRPGVTYRNVGITLRITSVFADIDRIVAEALGEVPTRDEAQPAPAPPASSPAPSPAAPPAAVAHESTSKTPPRRASVARSRVGRPRR